MAWGQPERSVRRVAPPRRWWAAAVLVLATAGTVSPLVVGTSPAGAAPLLDRCEGFGGCNVGGYTSHDYQGHMWASWWNMYPGTNCTNYVAFVEATVFHAPTPGYLLGNAQDWPASAAAHGVRVDNTPSVGAVAVWYGGAPGIPYPGHVAVVEQVAPGAGQIEISQDNISSDADGYDWSRLVAGGVGSNGWQSWPDAFVHFVNGPATSPAPAAGGGGAPQPPAELVRNGDFVSSAGWTFGPASNFTTYGRVRATSPESGPRFAATNTTSPAGGFYQDVPLQTGAGETVCAQVEVVTVGPATGARGVLALWLLGDAPAETAAASFGPLPGGNAWTPVSVCLTGTHPHVLLRVQIYDAPHTPTLGVDAVDAHASLAGSAWRTWPGSTFAQARNVTATGTRTRGGGIYQDIQLPISPGESFCADADVSGAHGALVLWLLGGAPAEMSGVGLAAARGQWKPATTCVSATTSHDHLRVQFYVVPGSGTLSIEGLDVHRSLVSDAGFDTTAGARAWRVWPHSAFATYLGNGLATVALEGAGYGVTGTAFAGGGIYQDVPYALGTGSSLCADAAVVSLGRISGARGTLVLWLLGNGPAQMSGVGFGPLASGSAWQRVSACISAQWPASTVRLQFYPAAGAPALGIDAVDLR